MMRTGDEMDDRSMDERLMSDDAVEDAVLRYLDESPEIVSGMAPSRDLWPDIEARIGARVLPLGRESLGRESVRVRRVHRRPTWLAMAAAAAVLVVGTAGVTYMLTTRLASSAPQVAVTPAAHVPSAAAVTPEVSSAAPVQVASAAQSGEATAPAASEESGATSASHPVRDIAHDEPRLASHAPSHVPSHVASSTATTLARYPVTGSDEARVTYDDEIARLHSVLESRRDQLDPATVATVEQNLRVIDNAIRQARSALVTDPHSRLLNDQLDRTLAKKTQLLRAATLLPAT